MKTPHKHAALIKAWADGETIEVRGCEWTEIKHPTWVDGYEYRIKPEPKPDVMKYMNVYLNQGYESQKIADDHAAPFRVGVCIHTFDGETGKLKSAEVV